MACTSPPASSRPEDESADPVGDGRSDALLAERLQHRPGRPNPEPDPPEDDGPIPAGDDDRPPGDDGRGHQPGREPALRRSG